MCSPTWQAQSPNGRHARHERTADALLTCRQLVDSIVDYVSGALAPPARAECETHLRKCADCARYLKAYEDTIQLAREALGAPDAPLPDESVRAILAARHKRR